VTYIRQCTEVATWTSADGALCLGLLGTNVLFIEMAGFYDPTLGLNLSRWLTVQLRKGPRHLFVDAERVSSVHPDARVLSTDVLKEHRTAVLSAHVLTKTALVRMALAVANLAMGGFLRGYKARAEWTRELDHVLAAGK
jgi:hypothetical protein